jgi:hypothetical protein
MSGELPPLASITSDDHSAVVIVYTGIATFVSFSFTAIRLWISCHAKLQFESDDYLAFSSLVRCGIHETQRHQLMFPGRWDHTECDGRICSEFWLG